MKKSVRKSVAKKSVRIQKDCNAPHGRDAEEVAPDELINADKTSMTYYNSVQRRPQSRSARYSTALARPHRTARSGMGSGMHRNRRI